MKIKNFLTISLIAILCLGCKSKAAPIVNNSSRLYTKNNYSIKNKYENDKTFQDKNLEEVGTKPIITVAAGDTLYSIAKKHNANIRDIIEENNLLAPYVLKVGSKISIPKSQYHQVKTSDTLYSISRQYRMNISDIVALNDFKSPYNITLGQKIKISNSKVEETKNRNKPIIESGGYDETAPKKTPFVERILDNKKNRFSWPLDGNIISRFGPKSGGLYNDGVNIKAASGTQVRASEEGVVAYVGNELKGYGNLIIVKHAGGWVTAYGHLSKTLVSRGEKVNKSQAIAQVGATGNVDSPQLYFGLRKGRDAVNPENYLKK